MYKQNRKAIVYIDTCPVFSSRCEQGVEGKLYVQISNLKDYIYVYSNKLE